MINVDCVCVYAQSVSHVQLFVTPWIVAHQALLYMNTRIRCISFPRKSSLPIDWTYLLHLLHWQLDFLTLVPPGKTEWVNEELIIYKFSS